MSDFGTCSACFDGEHRSCINDLCECCAGGVSPACRSDRHEGLCGMDGCACGCHWLMPLARGDVDRAVSPSGRTWMRSS